MRRKFEIGIVVLLIMTIASTNFFLLGSRIALAAQNNDVDINNIEFDAYFLEDEQKTYSVEENIDEEQKLFLDINVNERGSIDNGKITIENANFKILGNKVQNQYIKAIDTENNQIELNQIIYGNRVEIELPISFKKQESFSEDYFERENRITLNGLYKNQNEVEINEEVSTQIIWKKQTDITLSEEIEKYIDMGQEGILLQQKILSSVEGDYLPRKHERLEVNVPKIDEVLPVDVIVLFNEILKEDIQYDKQSGKLLIEIDNTGKWGKPVNEYKVIYTYYNIQFDRKTIDINTKLDTQLYMQENIHKEDIQNSVNIEEKGKTISISKMSSNDIYKGYLYAANGKETVFEDNNKIEISKEGEITLNENENSFLDEYNNKYDLVNGVIYKQTLINKSEFDRILGENGQITISDINGTQIAVINNNSYTNAEGNIELNYEQELNSIMINISEPIQCGVINIINTKALKSDTGYSKEQLKTFNKLNIKTNVESFQEQDIAESEVALKDTKTDAKIEINNKDLSTLRTNESIQLLLTLKSNSEEYDLFKNPTIQVVLPKEVRANIKNINQLNAKEELQIVNSNTAIDPNGNQIINLQLQGEQITFENEVTEGIQIAITADITIDKSVPSRADKIVMNYTNENREGISLSSYADVRINSKNGVMAINKISNCNTNNDEIEVIDNDIKIGNLDSNINEITAEQEINIVNNYDSDITDVSIIINNLDNNEITINNQTVNSNFGLIIKELLSTSEQIDKIYYSEDGNSWVEDTNNLKIGAIKLQLKDNKITANNSIELKYKLGIPAELGVNKSTYSNLELNYTYAGEEYTTNSCIVLKTEEINISNEEPTYNMESDGVKIEVIEKSAEGALKENQDVYEGQKIKYKVKLTNNTGNTIRDIKLEATHTNAIFWNHNKYNEINAHTMEEEIVTKYEENEELQKMILSSEELEPEETVEFEYQITAKNLENDDDKLSGIITIKIQNAENQSIELLPRKIIESKVILLLEEKIYEQTKLIGENGLPIRMHVKNNMDTDIENLTVELRLSDELYFSPDQFDETLENVELVEYKDGIVKFNIKKIKANQSEIFSTQLITKEIPVNKTEANAKIIMEANSNDIEYYSNEINRTYYQDKVQIIANQTTNIDRDYVENEDEVIFTVTIENKGVAQKPIEINDSVPYAATIKEAYILSNNNKEDVDISQEYNSIYVSRIIKANEIIHLVIKTKVDIENTLNDNVTNYASITGKDVAIKTNEITFNIKKENSDSSNNENDNDNNDNKDSQLIDNTDLNNKKYFISGQVWVDTNKNGKLDSNENKLNNIEVVLLDSDSGSIVKDETQQDLVKKTNNDGIYRFENIGEGKYIVLFKYDSTKFRTTEYKVQGVSENENSDIISKKINLNGENIDAGITETINIKGNDIENINAGFIENEKFDLKLDKYINKIIIQNSKGTVVNQYDNTQLAKIEIDNKQLSSSTVIIEYLMNVTNEGQLPGYASEIVDYIPSDLSFNSEMNKNWYQTTNGEICSRELQNTIINPGENTKVVLTLVKRMSQNNTGTTINTAEIKESNNALLIQDSDSIAGNKASDEDDTSIAQVIISIKTGRLLTYIALTVLLVLIIGIGVSYIKKRVISE